MRLSHSFDTAPAEIATASTEAIARVSAEALRKCVEALAMPRHYTAQRAANQRAGEWIAARLTEYGCEVDMQGRYENVVALPRDVKGPLTLICSHYDTVPETPGADDNGSAVAAMLEVARVLQGTGASVGFVCFNCEEDGLLGSIDFVEQWVPRNPGRIAAVHVLEMVGFCSHAPGSQQVPPGLPIQLPDRGDFLGLLANRDSGAVLAKAVSAASGALPEFPVVGLEVPDGLEQFLPVLLRSDHAPFWQARIPALMWTDTSEFRNPHYHQPSDTPETLDYAFLADVTRALVVAVM